MYMYHREAKCRLGPDYCRPTYMYVRMSVADRGSRGGADRISFIIHEAAR